MFRIRKKKGYSNANKEYLVYSISDQKENPRFLIFDDEKDEFTWVWASLYEPVTR